MGRATAFLSKANLIHNATVLKEKVFPAKIVAIIKSNAYGHGMEEVACILDNYVDLWGVVDIEEAMRLKSIHVKKPILLTHGVLHKDELLIAINNNFHVVFHSTYQLEWLDTIQGPLYSWLQIDTGLGALGFNITQASYVFDKLSRYCGCPPVIMSHLAASEDYEHPMNAKQINAFNSIVTSFDTQYSLCNSAAIMRFPECYFDYVRSGISMYGISPLSNNTGAMLGLKPVMTLTAPIVAIERRAKGDCVGYSSKYECTRDTDVAFIACGYYDGYPFSQTTGAPVIINDKRYQLLGRTSMNLVAADITDSTNICIGDTAILYGANLPIEEIIKHSSHNAWNTLVSCNAKRIWVD